MNWEILSERLSLRPVERSEAAALHRLWIDERVRRFLWDGEVIPFERTREIVDRNQRLFEEEGFGLWGVRERNAQELLGFAGYWHFRTPPSLELLFGVAADHWNRGIATESGRCVLHYGLAVMGWEKIEASTDAANEASARVLEKLGMVFRRRAVVDGLDTLFYTLPRAAPHNAGGPYW